MTKVYTVWNLTWDTQLDGVYLSLESAVERAKVLKRKGLSQVLVHDSRDSLDPNRIEEDPCTVVWDSVEDL